MSYAVAAVAFGLWWILGKKATSKLSKFWYLRPAILLIASASLADTGLGVWLARALGGVLGWAAGIFGVSGALAAGVIGLLLLAGTVLDLWDHKPDGIAKTGLILLPLLVLTAAGPLASGGAGLFDSVAQAGTTGLSSVIGG